MTPVSKIWERSWRTDVEARALADRHYSRQTPGAVGFVPPGRCLVLKSIDRRAYWVTSWPFAEYVKHEWAGAWVCSAFRNEHSVGADGNRLRASDMIREALAITVNRWPCQPRLMASCGTEISMVTFVDPSKVRHKRTPGRCFIKAGFVPIGETKGGLVALGLPCESIPRPVAAIGEQLELGWTA